jgi:hypothetical protein
VPRRVATSCPRQALLGRQRPTAGGATAALVDLVHLEHVDVRVTQEKLLRLRTIDAHRHPVVDTQPVELGTSFHVILDGQCDMRPRGILVRSLLGQW